MSLLGTVAAATTLFFSGNPQAALVAYSIGSGVDSYLNQPDRYGPRLDDLRTQMSVYGAPIPFEYGCNRHAGTVIWPRILEAVEHETTESSKGGPEQHNFTYTLSFAVLVCEGPIAGIRRIWANKKLIYDVSTSNEGATQDPAIGQIRIYLGTETQEVDPLIEATDGPSPAYLGYSYVMLEDYDVTELGGRPPQIEFEVIETGAEVSSVATSIGVGGGEIAYDPNTNLVWSVTGVPNTKVEIYLNDLIAEESVQQIDYVPSDLASSMGNDICYVPTRNEFWVVNENGTQVLRINATDQSITEDSSYTYPPGMGGVALNWIGLIHYSPANDNVIIANTNVSDSIYVIDAQTTALEFGHTDTGSIFGVRQILTLNTGEEAVLFRHAVQLWYFDGAASVQRMRYEDDFIGSNPFMAYDNSRNRLVIINRASPDIAVLDLESGVFSFYTLELPVDADPLANTNMQQLLWHEGNDRLYFSAHQAGLGWTLWTVNPIDYTVEEVRVYDGPTNNGTLIEIPGISSYLVTTDLGTGQVWKIPLHGLLDPNQTPLSRIVTDLCVRAGLTEDDIDVSQLTDMVTGYIVPRQMTARAAIEVLQQAFYFDAVESDDKIKFVKRGSATTTTILADDRAAHEPGQEMPASLEVLRAFETELPIQCDVEYPDIDADHQIGNQYDRRITKDTRHRVNLQLAVVMNATKAKEIARTTLYQAWQNNSFRWTTTRKYAYLEPTDIVNLPTDSATYRARITNRRDQPNGIIEWEGAQESVEVYSQSGTDGVTPPYQSQSVYVADPTLLKLLDIPLLRDEDNDAGFYIAMAGQA